MDKRVNYWPAWEEMLILFLREACRFLVDLVREFI